MEFSYIEREGETFYTEFSVGSSTALAFIVMGNGRELGRPRISEHLIGEEFSLTEEMGDSILSHIASSEEYRKLFWPYPPDIMKAVRKNMRLKEDDESMDEEIAAMDKDEVLNRTLNWHGLLGYGDAIRRWVNDIYKTNL